MARALRRSTYGSFRAPGKWRVLVTGLLLAAALLGMPPASVAQDRVVKVVALGDSLTAGYNLPPSAAFPSALEAALKARGHKVEIANAGVSGDTATGGLDRLDWSVPDGTDAVILELGANDMLRGIDPEVTRKALDTIITRLKERNVPVMLAGMYAARNLGPDYVRRFEAIYPELAKKHGLVLYPFFLDGVQGDAKLQLPDGLHPSAEGVKVMVGRILPSVESFLKRLKD
jgi:acyl-CoA thioesterase-1